MNYYTAPFIVITYLSTKPYNLTHRYTIKDRVYPEMQQTLHDIINTELPEPSEVSSNCHNQHQNDALTKRLVELKEELHTLVRSPHIKVQRNNYQTTNIFQFVTYYVLSCCRML